MWAASEAWYLKAMHQIIGWWIWHECHLQGLELDEQMQEELQACIGQLEAERELAVRSAE